MNPNVPVIIISIFAALIVMVFCVSFSSSLAKMKARKKVWGFLGLLLGPIGLIIVCYLPSKRDDNIETNPIKYLFSKIPAFSKKTIGVLVALAVVVIVTFVLYDFIPTWAQNRKYQSEITSENINTHQPKLINSEVERVFASGESSFALTTEGSVYCFGKQFVPSLDDSSIIFEGAKKVMSSESEFYVLDKDGKLFKTAQKDSEGEAVVEFVEIAQNVVDFSVSETTVGIIKTDGKLYMMGGGAYGQLGTYNEQSKEEFAAVLGSVTQVVCEADFTVALQKSGDAVVFGNNAYGQFAKEESGFNYPVSIHQNIKQIAAGDGFILLLDNDGNVLSCGQNDCGQLGRETATEQETVAEESTTEKSDEEQQETPKESATEFVSVLTGITQIDAAKKCAFALSGEGELFAWGQNVVGQLGNKNTVNQNLPVKVYEEVADFDTSGLHTVIITKKGKTYSTGFNNCGQLGRGDARDSFSTLVTIKTK